MRPRVHDIVAPRGGRPARRVGGDGARRARQAADGDEFLTLREYEVGDDLRRVHWRSTARTGELMIRQDEAQLARPRGRRAPRHPARAHDAESFEVAVEAAASVVDRLTRMRRRVEVITSDGAAARRTDAPATGWAVMDRLATIEPGGEDHFAAVLASSARTAARRSSSRSSARLGAVELGRARRAHGSRHRGHGRYPARHATAARAHDLRPALVAVDAVPNPFPTAWNQAMTRWHLAPPPRSPRSHSPR